jgi:hypothetical protein
MLSAMETHLNTREQNNLQDKLNLWHEIVQFKNSIVICHLSAEANQQHPQTPNT